MQINRLTRPTRIRENYAYTLGVQAYIHGFPWIYMPRARWDRTEARNTPPDRFVHFRELQDTSHTWGGAPNNDTLYSQAWVYLKDEPIILSVPEIRDRYYTMEITDFMGDNFAYVGVRTTGTKAGHTRLSAQGGPANCPPESKTAAFVHAVGKHSRQDVSHRER